MCDNVDKRKCRNIGDFSAILTMHSKEKCRNIGDFSAILFFSTFNVQLQCKNTFLSRACWKKNGSKLFFLFDIIQPKR